MAVLGVRGNTHALLFARRAGASESQEMSVTRKTLESTTVKPEPVEITVQSYPVDTVEVSSATPELPVTSAKPKKRSLRQQIFRPLKRTVQVIILAWLGIWGAASGYDAVIGDGPPPTMHALPPLPNNVNIRQTNSTSPIYQRFHQPGNEPSPQECWDSLEKTRALLAQFSPEVATWLESMHASGRIQYSPSQKNLAFFDVVSRDLNLHDGFFSESDRHKLAILTHEYWHSRQNAGKHIARLLSPKTVFGPMVETGYQYVTGRSLCEPGFTAYGSQVEDEAHQLERQASILLGIDTNGPDDYFRARGITPPHVHTNQCLARH